MLPANTCAGRWPGGFFRVLVNHYPHHIGDYLKDTAHLSLLEHGCYRRMLDVYYSREKPFSDAGEACKLIGARTAQERAAVNAVLSDYFSQEADGFHQKRCDEELKAYSAKATANRENGKKGGRPVTHNEPTKNPNGFDSLTQKNLNQNQEPITKNQEPLTKGKDKTAVAGATRGDPVKEEIWKTGRAILEGQGSSTQAAGAFLGKLCKEYGQILVLDALRDCKRVTPAEAKAWLAARCQERRKGGTLEERNLAATAGWKPPEAMQ